MTNPTPYSKKGERWVNHTIQPGSYVVNDPRAPPPPPPPYSKPTGQTWARPIANKRHPPNASPSHPPPSPYAIPPNAPHPHPYPAPPPPLQAPPPPVPIPQAFQTPNGKTPRFYDPDDFRKFTETHSNAAPSPHQTTYSTPVSDSHGRTFLPVAGDTNKRGPYSERLTRAEETELLKTCLKLKETYGAPSTQNKWWQIAAADFSVYRRKQGRNDLQAPTAKRRVELAISRRKREIEDGKESDEPPEYVTALNEWLDHTEKLDKGELQPLSSKQAAEVKFDEELERIKKEREEAERDHPLPTPPPSSSTPTAQGRRFSTGQNAQTPVMVSDSPPASTPQPHPAPPPPPPPPPPQHHPHGPPPPMHFHPHGFAPPAPPLTHHHHQPFPSPIDTRPAKRQKTEEAQITNVADKTASALDLMTKLASAMFESQQKELEKKHGERATNQDTDVEMNSSTDSLFSPAPTGNDSSQRLEEVERRLDEQKEAYDILQSKLDDITTRITKFTEEATAAETREKDRDKKMDKILQVLKKHFQGPGAQGQA